MTRNICSIYLGCQTYKQGLDYQRKAWKLVKTGQWDGVVIVLQHPAVITVGRHGGDDHLLVSKEWLDAHSVDLVHTNRGGDITCHNLGQLVCYPVINLRKWQADVHWYVRKIEDGVIRMLKQIGVTAGRKAIYSGVWIGNKKIAAVGIGVKHWITFHGTAVNVCNDLSIFSHVIPCGITEFGVTNLKEQGCAMSAEEVVPFLINSFISLFPYNTYSAFTNWSDLYGRADYGKTQMAGAAYPQ